MWNSSVSNGQRTKLLRKAARAENKPTPVIDVEGTKIGGGNFEVFAGPG